MPVLSIVILISGALMLARSAVFWLYFIQLKDYRFDRLGLELRQSSFYRLVFSAHRIIIAVLLAWALVSLFWDLRVEVRDTGAFYGFSLPWFWATSAYFLISAARFIYGGARHTLKLPKFTVKVSMFVVFLLAAEIAAVRISALRIDYLTPIIALEFFQPAIVLGIFALVRIPNSMLHRALILRAKKKLQARRNLIVVGITGSYGKTTIKEFLAHVLSRKFRVLKTPQHINVDTGIAKVILRDLNAEHQIFIVEMGAYRRGEIRSICDLVNPKYGAITGLSDQHLALFGSFEAIAAAKFELVEAISGLQGNIAANRDSELLYEEFTRRKMKPLWYGLAKDAKVRPSALEITAQGTKFMLDGVPFFIPIFGTAAVTNALGAITLAQILGMKLPEISSAISSLPPVEHTMQVRQSRSGAMLIDDTYNSNTDGTILALSDLKYLKHQKKIFVFGDIIELSRRAQDDHVDIAHAAAKMTAYALLLPSAMRKLMVEVLIKSGYDKNRIWGIGDVQKLLALADAETVILFEGRDAGRALKTFLPASNEK